MWQAVSPGLWHCWEGECAYYQQASGDTHLLSEAAVTLLECLQEGPGSLDALAGRLAQHCEPPADPGQLSSQVAALLDDLSKARLVECSPA